MNAWLLYAIVFVAYLPGLVAITRLSQLGKFPLVLFCFLGLFVFNALGSIFVLLGGYSKAAIPLVSIEYVLMLIVQALLFYSIAGTYVLIRRHGGLDLPHVGFPDQMFAGVLGVCIVLILVMYHQNAGGFLIFDLLSGKFDAYTVLQYRLEKSYGIEGFGFYRFGFFVLPALLATHVFLMCLVKQKFSILSVATIGLCMTPMLLLAEKSGVLYVVILLIIAYATYSSSKRLALTDLLNIKLSAGLTIAFVPTVLIYALYYGGTQANIPQVIGTLLFRIVGVYSEALAAAVPFVETYGNLGGVTLPTVKGLLPHDRVILEAVMHEYLWTGNFLISFSGLPGSVSVPAVGEGYINFGWAGFLLFSVMSFGSVVLMQEVLLRLRMGIISQTIMVWYAYLSMMIATTSIFATIISFVYTYLLVFAVLCYVLGLLVQKLLCSARSWLAAVRELDNV